MEITTSSFNSPSLKIFLRCLLIAGVFTPKEFKQLSKWAEEVYNIAVVVDYFCETQLDKEECYNLAPVLKYLHREADLLNAFFIDHEKDIDF